MRVRKREIVKVYVCVIFFLLYRNTFLNKPIFLFSDAQAAILCSRCDSRKDNYYGECEQYPPDPTPCPENSKSMYCSIVREIDFDGELQFFLYCVQLYTVC